MIQVGQVLDKYELLERVGQGGMAIVYRGIDRTLKRTVAIKILHKHLSDYQEARDRFEREAQAVAKLRHENILEIFDYSAAEDAEAAGSSYIVTEFIDGQTLKQFTTERPIGFPEVGAMIILQVCRALAHAHAAGILHRDVKPENIMIRGDGVVKLMDFGISHMVDLERLTITGQLLGSPAYMAPEHVEGRPLDFRTDVFAAGIVLYQLTVGKLPFEGKNPHEVLKRIAECRFVDPRQANPRIGNRLGRIILRAMAAMPDGRYPAIGEMVMALEGYLEESGLPSDKIANELARYFQAPVAYEQALKERLVDHLTRRGQKLLVTDKGAALDVFDRVLTIDKDNQKVVAILDGINRRRRLRTAGLAVLVAGVVAVGAWGVHAKMGPGRDEPPPPIDFHNGPVIDHKQTQKLPPADASDVAMVADAPGPVVPADAAVIVTPADGGRTPMVSVDAKLEIDAGADVPLPPADVAITVIPSEGSLYSVDDGPPQKVPGKVFLVPHNAKIVVTNPQFQQRQIDHVDGKDVTIELSYLPAQVTATCDRPVQVVIDGKPARLGSSTPIIFGNTTISTKTVTVEFIGGKKDVQTVDVQPNESKKVPCGPP